MTTNETAAVCHWMTPQTMDAFLLRETEKGVAENAVRRCRGALNVVYHFLPADKSLTKERLLGWRKHMEESGYASATILNYVKSINRYLDYVGCPEIRFNKGRAKDITGMTFGYLTAIEPTGEKNRGDLVWRFRCQCGKDVSLPATRALTGNTMSCGCLVGAAMVAAGKYCGGTSIVQSMTEKVESAHAVSGYTGVSPKGDKWLAYIKYKGIRYSLGCYRKLEDAVKARARAKELVIADAKGLLDFYEELEKTFPELPGRPSGAQKRFPKREWVTHDGSGAVARRSDNKSGHTGVCRKRGTWNASICCRGIRYVLGNFDALEDAVSARKAAEQLLADDPDRFVKTYETFPHHSVNRDA